jgi:hypothetical protein
LIPEEEKISYKELHKHVVNYSQTKNQESAAFILNAFDKLIWIYVHIITNNNFKIYNEKHRNFVSLFCPRWVYLQKNKYHKSENVRKSLIDGAQHINYIFRKYDIDEIKTECQIVMLNMALKYNVYDKPTFHTLVSRVYDKRLFSHLKKLVKDPFVRKSNLSINEELISEKDQNNNYENMFLKKMEQCEWHSENSWHKDYDIAEKNIDHFIKVKNAEKPILEKENQELSYDWINGSVCHEVFKELTSTERQILKLYYYNNLTDREIAKILNFCGSYTNKKRNKILKKIKVRFEELETKNEE